MKCLTITIFVLIGSMFLGLAGCVTTPTTQPSAPTPTQQMQTQLDDESSLIEFAYTAYGFYSLLHPNPAEALLVNAAYGAAQKAIAAAQADVDAGSVDAFKTDLDAVKAALASLNPLTQPAQVSYRVHLKKLKR